VTSTLDAPTSPPYWLLDAPREVVEEYFAALSPEMRVRFWEWIRAQTDWRRTPGTMAIRLDPSTVQTPALDLIDQELVGLIDSPMPPRGGVRGLIVSMPPQEGKSERCTRRFATWLLQRHPDMRIGLVSYGDALAQRHSALIRNDIDTFDGTDGVLDLGLRRRRGEDAKGRWNLVGSRGGILAIGVGSGLGGNPIDALLIDDPVKDYKAADSELQSNDAWIWWQSVARPRLGPGSIVLIVLTRWSDLDLAGRLKSKQAEDEEAGLEEYDEWRELAIPAQADHDPSRGETDPLGREPGEWMISARGRTERQWIATKNATTSPRIWAALYQQRPAPLEGGEIKRHWWKYSNTFPTRPNVWLASWDMKLKDKATGDYVVGGMLSRTGSKYHVHEILRGQWGFPVVKAAIALMQIRYPDCKRHIIENTGNGPEAIQELRAGDENYVLSDEIAGTLAMSDPERVLVQLLLRRGMSGLIPEQPKGSKMARMRAYSGLIEAGDVILPGADEHSAPRWVSTFVDECSAFGVGGSYDDQVDMLSQALKYLSRHDDDEGGVQVAEGVVPKQVPGDRAPGTRMSGTTRQARIVREQLGRRGPR
jgi:phage terminase large subunit-like protein